MPAVPDITSLYQTPDIQNAYAQSNQASKTASQYQSAAATLPAQLKDAIMKKLNSNQDIIDAQSKAQANYFAAPAQARSDYQDIFNPFDREALVAHATANAYAPYQSLTSILGQRQGNISDIVNAGVGAFNSQVGAEQNAAQLAHQNYADLISNAGNMAQAKEWQYQAGLPGGGTAAGAQEAQAVAGLQKDINSGATFSDLLQRYNSVLPEYQIRQLYNSGPMAKKYGAATETPAQENALLQGLPGLTGAKTPAKPKTAETTISAKTSTVKGNAKVDGWNLKLSNGQTVFVTAPSGTTGGFFGIGGTPVAQPKETAQQIYNDWKSAKLPENALIQALQSMGYKLQ